MRKKENLGSIYDVICEDKDFYLVMFNNDEPYFRCQFRRVIAEGMHKNGILDLPEYICAIFADRFLKIIKTWLPQDRSFSGELLANITTIWIRQCQIVSGVDPDDTSSARQFDAAVTNVEKYVDTDIFPAVFGRMDRLKNKLKKSFLELMQNKPYSEITVTEIVCNIGSGRTGFYKHYSNTLELYKSICDDFIRMLQNVCCADGADYYDIICRISAVVLGHSSVFAALLSETNSKPFRDRFVNLLMDIQMRCFGFQQEKKLHENVARGWLDFYEIFSREEVASQGYHRSVILGRCQAISETFDYCRGSEHIEESLS